LLTNDRRLPEDNPWGDRQLAVTPEALEKPSCRQGISFSNAPGLAYESATPASPFSAQVITLVAGASRPKPTSRAQLLQPLGMKDTVWEFAEVPPAQLALGYRWENEAWLAEPLLHDGTYGATGGLLTTLDDFARYVAFHLAAYPARDDADSGPVRRSTLRELHQPAIVSGVADGKSLAGESRPSVTAYASGLRWSMDSTGLVNIGHSGGLPGFGSDSVSIRRSASRSSRSPTSPTRRWPPPTPRSPRFSSKKPPSPPAPSRSTKSSPPSAPRCALRGFGSGARRRRLAENFFLDRSRNAWIQLHRDAFARAGRIVVAGPLRPENSSAAPSPSPAKTAPSTSTPPSPPRPRRRSSTSASPSASALSPLAGCSRRPALRPPRVTADITTYRPTWTSRRPSPESKLRRNAARVPLLAAESFTGAGTREAPFAARHIVLHDRFDAC